MKGLIGFLVVIDVFVLNSETLSVDVDVDVDDVYVGGLV
jgi:hypothetical protein